MQNNIFNIFFFLVTGCFTPNLNLENHFFPRNSFKHFEVSIALVLQLKEHVSVGMLYFQVFQLTDMPKLQMK